MAVSLNKVTLIGFVGRDPEYRVVPSTSKEVVSFSLATSDSWKDKNSGDFKSRTEWHNIVVWNDFLISFIKKSVKKGTRLYVEGELNYRKWQDKNTGANHVSAEVVLQNFAGNVISLDKKEGDSSYSQDSSESSSEFSVDEIADEIPF